MMNESVGISRLGPQQQNVGMKQTPYRYSVLILSFSLTALHPPLRHHCQTFSCNFHDVIAPTSEASPFWPRGKKSSKISYSETPARVFEEFSSLPTVFLKK